MYFFRFPSSASSSFFLHHFVFEETIIIVLSYFPERLSPTRPTPTSASKQQPTSGTIVNIIIIMIITVEELLQKWYKYTLFIFHYIFLSSSDFFTIEEWYTRVINTHFICNGWNGENPDPMNYLSLYKILERWLVMSKRRKCELFLFSFGIISLAIDCYVSIEYQ